ncbi:MAG: hypothetical protein NTX42_06610 [Methanothrix sp.]|nr:hypothetical protein [Methanothrix sp.]
MHGDEASGEGWELCDLQGDSLAILNEALHITRDCIPGHLDGLFYSLTVR